jgi:hypothetical protein
LEAQHEPRPGVHLSTNTDMSPSLPLFLSIAATAATSPADIWPLSVHRSPAEMNWNRFNQRQTRKNRRRAHAAGKRNAFR